MNASSVCSVLAITCAILIACACTEQIGRENSLTTITTTAKLQPRQRRQLNTGNANNANNGNNNNNDNNNNNGSNSSSSFLPDDVGWSQINAEVDMVIPRVVEHLQKLGIEFLTLTNLNESISVMPLIIRYEVGVYLTDGIAYNLAGIKRYGDAFMTYSIAEKSFVSRFKLIINTLQFEYNFMIRLTPFEGFGKVIGYLDDVIIYAELGVNIVDLNFKLYDFRIMRFGNIHVEIDQMRIIRQLSGAILSPITNLFRDRITTSISDGLKEQMQFLMDDFNGDDPLELRKFARKFISSLTATVIKSNGTIS